MAIRTLSHPDIMSPGHKITPLRGYAKIFSDPDIVSPFQCTNCNVPCNIRVPNYFHIIAKRVTLCPGDFMSESPFVRIVLCPPTKIP